MRNTLSYIVGILLVVLGMLTHSEAAIYTSDTTVTFAWTAPAGTPPASYNVFTSSDGVNFSQVGSTNNTSYDLNVVVGNTYYTAVQAVSPTGLAGPMSDASDAIVVVAKSNTLHTAWWSTHLGYNSYALIKNTSNYSIEVTPTFLGRDGSSYVESTPLIVPPHQAKGIPIILYINRINGQNNGALEISHSGNPGDVKADMFVMGPDGFSYSASMKDASAASTTLHTGWWSAQPGYSSYALIKNTSNNSIQVTPTFLGRDGSSYTSPTAVILPPHQAKGIAINLYVDRINGQKNGALELSHSGNPGDVVADILVIGPEGFSYSASMKDASAASTTLHTGWWSAQPGYSSYALIKNTSNNSIQVTPTFLGRDGSSYTTPTSVTLPPHQATEILVNQYIGNINGQKNGAIEISHSGNAGDVVANILVTGPYGFSYSASMKDTSATSSILHTAWWTAQPGHASYAFLKNTSNSTIQVTPTFLGRDGSSYVAPTPVVLAPHQAKGIPINLYIDYINGQKNGALEVSHTGNPGDVVAEIVVLGPAGFAYSAAMR